MCLRGAFERGFGNRGSRILVLFPEDEVTFDDHPGACFLFLESGADVVQLAADRDDGTVQALARVTLQAGKIAQAGGGVEIERVDADRAHGLAQLVEALMIFVAANRRGSTLR